MRRRSQYVIITGALLAAVAIGDLGFVATGGALPYGERFTAILGGGTTGESNVFQFGRGGLGGFLLAGPLREQVGAFIAIVALLVLGSGGVYWYGRRNRGEGDGR